MLGLHQYGNSVQIDVIDDGGTNRQQLAGFFSLLSQYSAGLKQGTKSSRTKKEASSTTSDWDLPYAESATTDHQSLEAAVFVAFKAFVSAAAPSGPATIADDTKNTGSSAQLCSSPFRHHEFFAEYATKRRRCHSGRCSAVHKRKVARPLTIR